MYVENIEFLIFLMLDGFSHFIDDCTRLTWVYLLNNKFEVSTKINFMFIFSAYIMGRSISVVS